MMSGFKSNDKSVISCLNISLYLTKENYILTISGDLYSKN